MFALCERSLQMFHFVVCLDFAASGHDIVPRVKDGWVFALDLKHLQDRARESVDVHGDLHQVFLKPGVAHCHVAV